MTNAIDIDEFLPEVKTYARDCPDPVARRFIREAARELCKRGRVWRERDGFKVRTPECTALCSFEDASIDKIEWAMLDDTELTPQTPAWLDRWQPDWSTTNEIGSPRFITQLSPNTLTVVPKASGQLKVRLVLLPSRTAMTLPEFLLEQYGTEIGKGAAGRILVLPGTEYTNPQLGSAYVAEFKSLLDKISVQAAKGQQNAPLRTKGYYF